MQVHSKKTDSSPQNKMANYAAMLHGQNDLRFEPAPQLGKLDFGKVRIQVKAVGICGSDVQLLKRGRLAQWAVEQPIVISHEAAGLVLEVGEGVQSLQVGDQVALEPCTPCWKSRAARQGYYHLCPDVKVFGIPTEHGVLRNVLDHFEEFCHKLPSSVTLEEGALCEPLSVGIHACRRGKVQCGKNVVILGAGPIGLMTLTAAKAFGATKIVVTDINSHNLALAEKMGATKTYLPSKTASPQEVADKLKEMLVPVGPQIVFDCVGFESTVQTAVLSCCERGRVVIVGMAQEYVSVPMNMLAAREVEMVGTQRYANTWPLCISLLEDRKIDIVPMVSHRFGFDEAEVAKGFDTALRSTETKAVKVMFSL
ncbi:hypothetical protein ABBQ38_007683 [Trebouxia sp. C0009 RCD-2024]